MREPFSLKQRTTIVYGVLGMACILVVLQLWLLSATMHAYLGGDDAIAFVAAGGSLLCLLLNLGLLRFIYAAERERP